MPNCDKSQRKKLTWKSFHSLRVGRRNQHVQKSRAFRDMTIDWPPDPCRVVDTCHSIFLRSRVQIHYSFGSQSKKFLQERKTSESHPTKDKEIKKKKMITGLKHQKRTTLK